MATVAYDTTTVFGRALTPAVYQRIGHRIIEDRYFYKLQIMPWKLYSKKNFFLKRNKIDYCYSFLFDHIYFSP